MSELLSPVIAIVVVGTLVWLMIVLTKPKPGSERPESEELPDHYDPRRPARRLRPADTKVVLENTKLPTAKAGPSENAEKLAQAPSNPKPVRTPAPKVATPRPTPAKTTESGIFISYRRQDEPNFAGRLYDRLEIKFDRTKIFMDVDSIDLGLDFAEVINQSLMASKAMIVVIGEGWLGAQDQRGRRRLDNPNDYVRLEIETALSRKIRVIPVLVEGASVPDADELPESLESLSRRNGIAMSHARFSSDADRLIETLERVLRA